MVEPSPATCHQTKLEMANTLRPNSSQSQRPHSSLSLRAPSRTSSRPLSRISGRTYLSRYAAKTIHLARVLVSNVTKMDMDDDPNEFPLLYEKTLRALETKQMFTETMESTEARIRRVSRKARINMQDNLGEALLQSWDLLKASASDDFEEDEEIRLSNLPELMQFLPDDASPNGLKLSHSALEEYLPVVKSDLFNHFPNPAYTNREIVEAIQQKQSWRPEWDPKILWNRPFNVADPSTLGAMADSVSFSSKLSIRTTTPRFIDEVDAVRNALLILQGIDSPLLAFLNDDHDEPTQASIHPEAPRVLHLSAEAYRSILTELCFVATRLQELRYFASSVFALSATKLLRTSRMKSRYSCRTLEAFAEGVHKYIIDIEKWCAERDEAIVQARNGVGRQIVVTLLSLHYDVKSKATATLELLQDILRRLLRSESHHLGDTHHQKDVEKIGFLRAIDFGSIAPHRLSTRLLDFIQDSIDIQLAIGDYHAASKLSELFVATAEPLWKSVGKWVSNGITISLGQGEDEDYFDSLDKELFIRRRSTDFIDPEFWERGYILHTEVESDDDEDEDEEEEKEFKQSQITFLVPRIFMAIAEDVLRVGKAVGLLRAIGIEPFHDQEKLSEMRNWCSFSELYQRYTPSSYRFRHITLISSHLSAALVPRRSGEVKHPPIR
ncbi:hypothetical protein FRB91_010387 [Serendipita sp. 411]|nr:hypothetical protein FRB91_010387 [Serendipita sp. 411]